MESVVDGNGGSGGLVVMELSHIKELVRQLEGHLGGVQTQEVCKHLASQISSLTERSITLVTSSALVAGARKRSAAAHSPLSDASDAPFKPTKKRKTAEKVKLQVKVSSAAAGDAPADDGHSWRKYGQKEILGAKHPRAYYRCTHRHSQGCAATKQVQRTDEDPALFDVVYIGDHTCVQRPAAGKPEQKENPDAHGLLQSLSSSLTVKTEGLAVAPLEEPQQQGWIGGSATATATTPAFCLSSTPAASGCLAPSTSDNWGVVVSPATSDSDLAASFPPLEAAGEVRFGEVMSALVDIPDDFADFDISSFFA